MIHVGARSARLLEKGKAPFDVHFIGNEADKGSIQYVKSARDICFSFFSEANFGQTDYSVTQNAAQVVVVCQ